MTTTDRPHLRHPDHARLTDRLADANEQGLVLFNATETRPDPFTFEWRTQCTPSSHTTPYHQWIRWDMAGERVYAHCDCNAGTYGVACKHIALLGDTVGVLSKGTAWMILDVEEHHVYETRRVLPEWKGQDDG